MYKNFNDLLRIEPADKNGFHIVDIDNGGERIYVPYEHKQNLIDELKEIQDPAKEENK